MRPYVRRVQYYETDKMGVTHHANYIHWMEEARIDFMEQLGFPYERREEAGVYSPVRSLSCEYRRPCSFGDTVTVCVAAEELRGAGLTIRYEMRDQKGELLCTAKSEHAFLSAEGRIVRMKREMPEFCAALERAMEEGTDG